ncbi:MAG: glucose-6-phosphate isomerase family protein [Candidatus Limnocylindrales bacterium]
MPDQTLVEPIVITIDAASGIGSGFSGRYAKTLGDLTKVYRDEQAFLALAKESRDDVAYEVFATPPQEQAGELIVGTSVVYPGQVGDEFFMTRGHIHQIHGRAEMYYCLSGHGVMLLESLDGEVN